MLPMHARHFLSGRGRPSSSAIQSNNCFITGPSRKSFVASIALACSGGKSVSRGGTYLFFLPDSFRGITEISVLFDFRKRQKPAQCYRRNSYLLAKCSYAYGNVSQPETKSHKRCTDQKAADSVLPWSRAIHCGLRASMPCSIRSRISS